MQKSTKLDLIKLCEEYKVMKPHACTFGLESWLCWYVGGYGGTVVHEERSIRV